MTPSPSRPVSTASIPPFCYEELVIHHQYGNNVFYVDKNMDPDTWEGPIIDFLPIPAPANQGTLTTPMRDCLHGFGLKNPEERLFRSLASAGKTHIEFRIMVSWAYSWNISLSDWLIRSPIVAGLQSTSLDHTDIHLWWGLTISDQTGACPSDCLPISELCSGKFLFQFFCSRVSKPILFSPCFSTANCNSYRLRINAGALGLEATPLKGWGFQVYNVWRKIPGKLMSPSLLTWT